ncbi:MAG TPA: hypothetical protein H9813_03295 [Candidatus Fournierella merdipullorum]|uniref:Uncharacterized protein n=1 Tax=Candidatus Allofournierella merdipullorum TaxID=2838595 RepID=A0A9D2IYS6_9FIRM|nr:hypothetical protein [Candidatus Fournierella merdipullorum]
MEETKKRTVKRRSKKGEEHTARTICRALLARTLPADAADFGVLQAVADGLEKEQGSQPDLYQLMMLVQLQKAMNGDTRAATFVRDCAGDKPEADGPGAAGLTEGDRALLRKLMRRLEQTDGPQED